MSIWWSLHLRREAASVPLARRFLLGTMETAGVDPDISFDLSVALSEACANAVEHGGDRSGLTEHGDRGTERAPADSGQYRVTAYLDGEKCRIEVADSGPGFPARRALRPAAHTEHAEHVERAQQSEHVERAQQPEQVEKTQHPEFVGAQPTFAPYIPCVAESGRGLDLIEQLADHVQFGNRPGRGAVVSFDKVLKWREGALLMV
ncbi:ATP-binding protein [Streptomyces sp. ISL-111]|uniref:ATP-binding protein n=1 Tax=unclassified Streptomyces TaxID=2593676 RepID=UPI001BE6DCB5|nr:MULTISPECIES: ATP-binding protein [unclassified Streptomyces]MBT2381502.1 ATP-binding protein [Streptomyces sp. ISL-111]MBT2424839.1 ATP-binding protein [Streptomyces sp. ISL-112]MBT2463894.1 ATP-binding protein [Streptomyces sp. ISL-63]